MQGVTGAGDMKELLLYLRRICDGDEMMSEDFCFVKSKSIGHLCKTKQEREDMKHITDDNPVATMTI